MERGDGSLAPLLDLERDLRITRPDANRVDGTASRAIRAVPYVDLWAVPLLSVARDDIEVARSVIVNRIGRERVQAIRANFRALEQTERLVAARREASAGRRADLARAIGIAGIVLVLTLTASLAWQGPRGAYASLGLRYVSGQYEDDLNRQLIPGALAFDALADVPLTRSLAIEARAENLTDEEVVAGISGAGIIERATPRTFWLGLRWRG